MTQSALDRLNTISAEFFDALKEASAAGASSIEVANAADLPHAFVSRLSVTHGIRFAKPKRK